MEWSDEELKNKIVTSTLEGKKLIAALDAAKIESRHAMLVSLQFTMTVDFVNKLGCSERQKLELKYVASESANDQLTALLAATIDEESEKRIGSEIFSAASKVLKDWTRAKVLTCACQDPMAYRDYLFAIQTLRELFAKYDSILPTPIEGEHQ